MKKSSSISNTNINKEPEIKENLFNTYDEKFSRIHK